MVAQKSICLFLACLAFGALAQGQPAVNKVSVEQLERLLSSGKSRSDADQARQLFSLELTERLSTARFQQLQAPLPGEKSRQALQALADESAFLAPPANEIPATAAPDQASQRRMMAQTVHYLAKTLPLLPNLFATRDTTRFESRPLSSGDNNATLRMMSRSAVTVFYRDGHEFLDANPIKTGKPKNPEKGLTTWGEFGPILGTVVMDAAKSQLTWSHWELNGVAPLAVFRYSVPKEKSHYDVKFCCVTESYGMEVKFLTQRSGYHGEITLDPDSGTILRLTVIADLEPNNPIARASLLVEYGPVELGGKSYLCPVRGVAVALAPDSKTVLDTFAQRETATSSNTRGTVAKTSLTTLAQAPQQVFLNDVSFGAYHLFHTDLHILSKKEEQEFAAAPAPANPASPKPAAENAKPAEAAAAETPSSSAPVPSEEVAATTLAGPAPPPEIPEVYVTGAGNLPDAPAIPPGDTATPYRINARLVDVSLVALDKKGKAITNLNPAGIEVYDNGVKVDLRSFSAVSPAPLPAEPAAQPTQGPAQSFSNRRPESGNTAPADAQNTIVLLIDNTLSYDDFVNVREQAVRFLRSMEGNERVAIYVMNRGSFKLMHEVTTEHATIADVLAKWVPTAASVSLGQEQEARNRQSMDYVRNTEDLLSVNGHSVADNQSQTEGLDPQLRELGDNPGQDALSALLFLARHLATMAGHKNLIWIASDNVLADWTNNSLDVNVGSRNIEPAALRVQEAMNDAHVSVYPLDASRLEAGGIGASIADRNVQLNPTASANQMGGCGAVTGPGSIRQSGALGPELGSGTDITTCGKNLNPGRMTAQMQQDLHSIQGVYREIADATGGRAFRRASDIVKELDDVAAYSHATYQLSFTPPGTADDKYHLITIKVPGQKNVDLRYRKGYFYHQEPSSIKMRFRDTAMQPENATEIGLTANVVSDTENKTVRIGIAATDLAVAQKESLWTDKLDVFLVQRSASGTKAQVSGQSIYLRLRSSTYQKYMHDGIPFDQQFEVTPGIDSIRIIVLDENSGRMGSVTIPVHPGKAA